MNSDVIQGKWKQMTGDVKKFFGKLTDDDMQQINGDSEKMLGRLQERYGYTREQAEAEWSKFSKQHGDMWDNTKGRANRGVEDAVHDAKNEVKDAAHDVRNAAKDKATDVKNAFKR